MALPSRVGIIYDSKTLALRRVIIQEDHEDGSDFDKGHFHVTVMPGEEMIVVEKSEVRGMQLYDMAVHAMGKIGKVPPPMEEVHAKGL